MDDKFMDALKQPPSAEFAGRLRDRLRDQEPGAGARGPRVAWRRGVLSGAAAASLLLLLMLPAVRASAQAFFDLFRVVNFAVVPVDVGRLDRLSEKGLDLRDLIGRQVHVISDPGAPQIFFAPQDAGRAAGFHLKEPMALPPDLVRVSIEVSGERVAQIVADTQRLADVLVALGITDLRVPSGLDGQTAVVRVPPVVHIEYGNGDRTLTLLQSRSPEITAPATVDLARLGEIGLRIAGLDPREAYTLAQAIDWRSTLVVPVPIGSSTFRQLTVRGQRGVLIESSGPKTIRTLAWSSDGVIYGLISNLDSQVMLIAAESLS